MRQPEPVVVAGFVGRRRRRALVDTNRGSAPPQNSFSFFRNTDHTMEPSLLTTAGAVPTVWSGMSQVFRIFLQFCKSTIVRLQTYRWTDYSTGSWTTSCETIRSRIRGLFLFSRRKSGGACEMKVMCQMNAGTSAVDRPAPY
ncbi:unnamed protein product [Caenorhabditis auriculariae]|uniref:Uncharacterized protein n=1 Tax=Caenorhabditis auriculariae TaxID=2777116 RepID=A0A8S1HC89_9PELO|nr:unnamed protein product [Caenorhabditis auriculariae]